MADELLNCPFCGSQAAWPEPEVNMNYVQCMSCSATANHAGEWNRRTPPTPATDEREAVARALYDHESPNSALAWEHKPAHFQENVRRYADAALSALREIRAAEILAAEANERARIATYLNMRAEQWRDLAVAHSGDALKWADCSARENELLRQAIAIEPNEHGAGK